MQTLLLASAFVVATCGLVYELAASTLASYVLGDSVTQFSTIIGVYLFSMGVGSWGSRYIKKGLLAAFVRVELLCGLVGGLSAAALDLLFTHAAGFRLCLYSVVGATGFLVGLEIPLILRLLKDHLGFDDLVSKVLTFDYVGALAGSLLFPLLLIPHLGIVRTALLFGLLNVGVAALALRALGAHLPAKRLHWAAAIGVALILGTAFAFSGKLEDWAEAGRFPDPVIHSLSTRYQRITLTHGRGDLRLYLNGNLQFASKDEYRYHEALIHPGLASVPGARRVLILGGGDGLAAREVLRYASVRSLTLVDLDGAMTSLFSTQPALVALNGGALTDPRMTVVHADAFAWLAAQRQDWDVIVADFPDPNNFALGKLFSTAFYATMKAHLAPGGAAIVQSTSPYYARRSYWCVERTLQAVGFDVTSYHCLVPSFGEWGFHIATVGPWREPSAFPPGLRFLDKPTLDQMLVFPVDMARVPSPVNRLNHQELVRLFEQEWSTVAN